MTGRWWSQPFPPEGAITAEGIANQLGRPEVDPLTVFVRETAQNSWDARLPEQSVRYGLHLDEVAPEYLAAWREMLSVGAPGEANLGLVSLLARDRIRLLAVTDRGTTGLDGPLGADEPATGRARWRAFVNNVGDRRAAVSGGGTYGYGKAVLYRLSTIRTVIVHSRTRVEGRQTTRLMGVALGESFVDPRGVPYTGRHWWGAPTGGRVRALEDAAADETAERLGMPPFADEETGTSVIVLEPDFGDDAATATDELAAQHLADIIAWQLWPIMLERRGSERLVPSVSCGGLDMCVPDPMTYYPLNMFVGAYRALPGATAADVWCRQPKKLLGRLAVRERIVTPSRASGSRAAELAGVAGDPHHVCLMRQPELVVRYVEGPAPFAAEKAYAGVFRADGDLDAVFASSEPPTHDNWVPDQLAGTARTFVRVTHRRIKEFLRDVAQPLSVPTTEGSLALGGASRYFGSLLPIGAQEDVGSRTLSATGEDGPGRGVDGGDISEERPRKRGHAGRVTARTTGSARIVRAFGRAAWAQEVAVTGTGELRVSATAHVRTADGGMESNAPMGAESPRVLGWKRRGFQYSDADLLMEIEPEQATGESVTLYVAAVADCLIDVRLRAQAAAVPS